MPKKQTTTSNTKIFRNVKPDFVDVRGSIIRPVQDLVKEKIKSVSIITSPKGVIRGNHYHKKESHYTYVLTGEITHYERPADSSGRVRQVRLKAGDMAYTPGLTTHAIRFHKESILIYFTTLHRMKPGDAGDTFRDVITK